MSQGRPVAYASLDTSCRTIWDVLGTKSVLGIDVPKMLRNIERLQIQVKSFENV